jgi:hypothetical protein
MAQKPKRGRPVGTTRVGRPVVGKWLEIPCPPFERVRVRERHRWRASKWGLRLVTRTSPKKPSTMMILYTQI